MSSPPYSHVSTLLYPVDPLRRILLFFVYSWEQGKGRCISTGTLNNTNITFSQCTVRLVGWGNDSSQGRVEVYVNGTWGGVCGYGSYLWNLKAANVVCRQLGFKGAVAAATSSDFPQKKLIFNLQCKGNEMSLTKCEHVVAPKGGKYCTYNGDTCVVCITGTTSNAITIVVQPWTGSKYLLPVFSSSRRLKQN